MIVELVADAAQLPLLDLLVQIQQLLLDRAFLEHQHEEHLGAVNMHQLHVFEAAPGGARGRGQGGALRRARQHRRPDAQPLIHLLAHSLKLAPNRLLLDWGQGGRRQQIVDKKAEAQVCRHAPCAGVGMGQESHALQRGQFIAHRGWADAQVVVLHDVGAADRLRRLHVLLDHDGEQTALALRHPVEGDQFFVSMHSGLYQRSSAGRSGSGFSDPDRWTSSRYTKGRISCVRRWRCRRAAHSPAPSR